MLNKLTSNYGQINIDYGKIYVDMIYIYSYDIFQTLNTVFLLSFMNTNMIQRQNAKTVC